MGLVPVLVLVNMVRVQDHAEWMAPGSSLGISQEWTQLQEGGTLPAPDRHLLRQQSLYQKGLPRH